MHYDVIIIGSGAAGLMALHDLSNSGHRVCLIEASGVIGGRIAPIRQADIDNPVETGAEFIHGKATLTLQLLKKAGISCSPVEGGMYPVRHGIWLDEDGDENNMEHFPEKIESLEDDISIRDFLGKFFSATEYETMRQSIRQMAEGFSLADIDRASIRFFQRDIAHLDETDYRIDGGYITLMNYLFTSSSKEADIHFNKVVSRIQTTDRNVRVYTHDGDVLEADHIIVTVSAGVLQSGDIQIDSLPQQYAEAITQLGFGSVIKLLFQFSEPFWEHKANDAGFILSDEFIPTWWTQLPERSSLLTGWLGGPKATLASQIPGDELYHAALVSLSNIFSLDPATINKFVMHHKIVCWDNQTFVKGGYSYNTLQSENAKNILRQPINGRIYFAGEAIYSGAFLGTVEAALVSGELAARQIIARKLIPYDTPI